MSKFFGDTTLVDMPVFRALFNNPKLSWVWLLARVWVGVQWVQGSLHKLSDPAWMQTGDALKGFWMHVVAIPEAPARPLITFDWYRTFIQSLIDSNSHVWFAKVISISELLVGIALILGVFAGTAAFFGGLMNLSFMLAGSTGAGPLMLVIEILLMVAWKIAGHIGVNYFIHNKFGTFWQPGPLLKKQKSG